VRAAKPGPRRKPAAGPAPSRHSAAGRTGLSPRSALALIAAVVVVGGLALFVGAPKLRHAADGLGGGIDRLLAAQGLEVENLTVQGASPLAVADIARATGVYRGQPILHLDLADLRHRVEQVGWVKTARVVRLLPDTLVIAVTERQTFAVWQHGGRTLVIDGGGHAIPEADPARFANLPLVVGDGADTAAARILPIVAAHPLVMRRLDAAVRVDDRRWDLRMKDGGLIQLPAEGEDAALARLDKLDGRSRILELGFERIDLRDPELVAVRPRAVAPAGKLVANGA
jgi:cell division protein FtsQ